MWKNWIPFRRKEKGSDISTGKVNGKENTQANIQHHQNQHAVLPGVGLGLGPKSHQSFSNDGSHVLQQCDSTEGYDNRTIGPSCREHDSSSSVFNNTLPSRLSQSRKDDYGGSCGAGGNHLNHSFTAVHGPLLSTPIMPKVKRALETNAGLRSGGRPSLLSRGKPVGRSTSLNYGSVNPAKSRAGQVPWVRLKRRESLGLSDYISTRPQQSPNTVKLAPPINQGLPAAPSFKSSPMIVTTEASRSRVLDTQTVVSALREKRKRYGETHGSESISEDMASWHASPKRRRQDSSQSNASSVSIPSMPDTLPSLMPSPGPSSIIHIEHLSQQRPSTIPAVDVFSNHLKPGLGGGEQQSAHESVLTHSRQEHRKNVADVNNSRLTQKALQSSLSSSMRARNNLSLLERGGIDLKRIRNHSSSLHRRASDASTLDRNLGEPLAKAPCLASQPMLQLDASNLEQESTSASSCSRNVSFSSPPSSTTQATTVSAPTKRKIAEGVLMRKQSLAMSSPLRSLKTIPSNGLMTASDFEKDKQKEYQRRVLDLLQPEDKETASAGVDAQHTPVTGPPPALPSVSTLTSTTTTITPISATNVKVTASSSSSATSQAISASLDSLSKLVQATSPAKSSAGITSTTSSSLAASSGFSFGLPSSSSSSQPSPQPVSAIALAPTSSTSSGFQVNFGNIGSSASSSANNTTNSFIGTSSTITTASSSLSNAAGLASNAAASFNFGASLSSSLSSSVAPPSSQPTGFSLSANITNTSTGLSSLITSPPPNPSTTPASGFQFGMQSTTTAANPGAGIASPSANISSSSSLSMPSSLSTSASASQPGGGFVFGATQNSSSAGGFPFGGASSHISTLSTTIATATATSSLSSSTPMAGGFTLGAPQASVVSTAAASGGGGFNFGAQSVSPSSQPVFGAAAPSISQTISSSSSLSNSNSGGGFQFGASVAPSSTAASSSLGGFSFNVAGQSQPNASANQAPVPTPTNQTPGMSMFTANKPNNAGLNFSQNQNPASSVQSSFTFGAGNNLNTTASQSQPGQFPNTTNTSSSVNKNLFGAPASTSSGIGGAFGAPTATANPGVFSFGGAPTASSTTATQNPFGASATGTTSANPFGNSSTSATATPAPFAFGATTTTGNANALANAPTPFGNQATTTTMGQGHQSPFGNVGVTANPSPFGTAAASTATKPSPFGAPQATALSSSTPSVFGAAPTANAFGTSSVTSPPAFGSTATPTAPVFGAGSSSTQPANQNQPFTFGTQPVASTINQRQPTAPAFGSSGGGSVFGGGNSASITGGLSSSSVFGNPASTASTAFGTGMSQVATTSNQPSVFGAVAPAAAPVPSVFGSSSSLATPAPAFGSGQTGSVFGAGTNSAPVFGAAAAATGQKPSGPVFGSAATPQNTATTAFGNPGGFGTPAKPNAANPFGAPASTTQGGAAAFAFNGTQASGQNPASPFGAAATTNTASTGFNFGSATQPASNPSGGFNFSAPASNTPAFQSPTPNPGGFNFTPGAGATTPSSFNFNATPGTPNMFTPQTPGAGHRPRVAARRGARRGRR